MELSLSITAGVISLVAVLVAIFSLRVASQSASDAAWRSECQAYREWESGADKEPFLQIHGLTREKLAEYGLTPGTFREYQLWLLTLMGSSLSVRGLRRIRREPLFDKKVALARKVTWSTQTRSGKILRSLEFRNAWRPLQEYWSFDSEATMAALIEAAVRNGE